MSDKILVAYFSAQKRTGHFARRIAEALNADLYEIRPEIPYTSADLNWRDSHSRSSLEMNDESSRPAIASPLIDIRGYKTILLGFPIWWYVEPRIIDSFIDQASLNDKEVVAFATSGGSSIKGAVDRMKTMLPNLDADRSMLLTSSNLSSFISQFNKD